MKRSRDIAHSRRHKFVHNSEWNVWRLLFCCCCFEKGN